MNDADVTRYLSARPSYSLWAGLKYYLRQRQLGSVMFAIYAARRHVGNCGFFGLSQGQAELRIVIGEKACWGQGVGQAAVAQMLQAAAYRGLRHIWLHVNPENTRAVRLYRKMGFEMAGEEDVNNAPRQARLVFSMQARTGGPGPDAAQRTPTRHEL
jgi:RimJ/RimL family protein N-acetyltransferase